MLKKLAGVFIVLLAIAALATTYFHNHSVAVLSPQGTIASQERSLIITATLLMLLVVVPVFVLTFTIAWRYRAGNPKAKHSPDWDHNRWLEAAWWGIPGVIITVLAVIAWNASHALDPFRAITASAKPLTIQVIALQWKWLFIYPDQHIASVNSFEIPARTPVTFEVTADAPMNSFWIPQLGGQIYAMPGMSTQLHLMASGPGSYHGSSANISGSGFADMHFNVQSASSADFKHWVSSVQQSPQILNLASYSQLAKPSTNQPSYFSSAEPGLYDSVVMKYMSPDGQGAQP